MEKIEVGEYARTDKGYIFKIDKEKVNLNIANFLDVQYGKIVNHSKNIIDLIEVGDFVNGYKIIAINYIENYITIQNINEFGENGIKVLQEDEIETILTKEQYQSNCYTVERKEEC